ncbi:hypothetical protein D3C72_2493790 [compost metagenome]
MASKSTDSTYCGITNGIMRSRSSSRATSTSLAPVENRCETVPSDTPSTVATRKPSRSTQ